MRKNMQTSLFVKLGFIHNFCPFFPYIFFFRNEISFTDSTVVHWTGFAVHHDKTRTGLSVWRNIFYLTIMLNELGVAALMSPTDL